MEELALCAGDAGLGVKEKDSSDPTEPNDFGTVLLAKENLAGRAELLAMEKKKL